ncbi:sugar ABC transporter permease [Streptomyces sp. AK02-01A]|uniref:carbohydrate ABC transporter permease n=1 Tax=Streptomyces sp. AK02-01A TaxID=3028648 RepID=UPI0029AB4504|nr:sugar ABC transporter permease [Streptomyces sp. AK02-01A]MDX3852189.1 sugar ABC transporter permease [Streptomyces sp. AK02-01A]
MTTETGTSGTSTGATSTSGTSTGTTRRGHGPGVSAKTRTGVAAGVLLAPFFVLFTVAMVIPIGYALWLSLFTEKQSGLGFDGPRTVFHGLGNYADALGDQAFRDGFWVLLGYCAFYIPLMVGGALILSLLLDTALARARRFFQLALFLPHAIPGLIAALIWIYLYTPQLSPVVQAMEAGGLGFDFFSSEGTLPSVVNIALWEWLGYNVVIFYASLQAIDRSLLEAATVDGAGQWRLALSIKFPLIRASLGLVLLFTVIGSLQLFTEPLILSRGSGSAVTSTWTPNMYAYSAAFERNDYGLAAAASVLIALVAAALSFGVTRFSNRKEARA